MGNAARVFGVLGDPIGHSRSAAMHSAAFASLGLPHHYVAFHVPASQLAAALHGARSLGLGGLNLTVPHKQAACAQMDTLGPIATRIGAVNTVCIEGIRLVGRNTDGHGFIAGMRELQGPDPQSAVVLGSGGAARAVVDALHFELGARVVWVTRRPVGVPAGPWLVIDYASLPEHMEQADLLVNATTVGMVGGPTTFPMPLGLDRLQRGAKVIDLVYPRPVGGLLDEAAAVGYVGQDGRPMLLWQGVRALEHWLGRPIPVATIDAMRRAIEPPESDIVAQ